MPNLDTQTIQLAVVAVVALALLLQAFVLLAIFVTVRRGVRSIKEEIEDMRSSVMPFVYNSRDLLAKMTPKIEAVAEDIAGVVHGLRKQSTDLESAGAEITERLRHQTSRLDAMLTRLLDSLDRTCAAMAAVAEKPIRRFSGVLACAKAVVDTLRDPNAVRRGRTGEAPGGDSTA